jgi:hypothetical protein
MLILFIAFDSSYAHSDPLGIIYPIIKIENNHFALYYFNNENNRSFNRGKLYKEVYSKDGKLLKESRLVQLQTKPLDFILNTHQYIYQLRSRSFINVVSSQHTFLFPRFVYPKELWYCLKVKTSKTINDDIIITGDEILLPNSEKIDNIYTATSLKNNFFLAVTEVLPQVKTEIQAKKKMVDKYSNLFVYDYKLQNLKFEAPKRVEIGNPERILNIPLISKLIYYKSKLFVAWITNVGDSIHCFPFDENTASLNLTCIDLEKQDAQTFLIKNKVHPNTYISMNILDGTIMFAYHQGAVNGKPKSKIVTILKKIDKLPEFPVGFDRLRSGSRSGSGQ